mmetsp:Transcript_18223/g.26421  ORF Transcript_18223/g.26421 Transcript_18223/m.26421 type:complete len:232 (-) Transcript_18223:1014-1709(-)
MDTNNRTENEGRPMEDNATLSRNPIDGIALELPFRTRAYYSYNSTPIAGAQLAYICNKKIIHCFSGSPALSLMFDLRPCWSSPFLYNIHCGSESLVPKQQREVGKVHKRRHVSRPGNDNDRGSIGGNAWLFCRVVLSSATAWWTNRSRACARFTSPICCGWSWVWGFVSHLFEGTRRINTKFIQIGTHLFPVKSCVVNTISISSRINGLGDSFPFLKSSSPVILHLLHTVC